MIYEFGYYVGSEELVREVLGEVGEAGYGSKKKEIDQLNVVTAKMNDPLSGYKSTGYDTTVWFLEEKVHEEARN